MRPNNTLQFVLFIGASAAAVFTALMFTVVQGDAKYTFPEQGSEVATRRLIATVRVFSSASASANQMGSGFVIDRDDGLILTAAHVVRGHDVVWVAFPRSDERHQVRVINPDASNSMNGHSPPDIAIMRLDPTLPNMNSLEVQFDKIDSEKTHQLTGYGRKNSEPEEGSGKPAWTNECTYTMKTQTVHGDSGSAVLTPEGLVDGIAVDGAKSGGTNSYSEMKVLPLSCVMPEILNAVGDRETDSIMNTLLTGDESARQNAFQPPPRAAWVSNLRLAKAISHWSAAKKTKHAPLQDARVEEALEIIVERGLGYKLLVDFTQASMTTEKAAADTLQRFADAELQSGSSATAIVSYTEAAKLYLRYTSQFRPIQFSEASNPVIAVGEIATLLLANFAYKDAASNMTKLARLTGKKEDQEMAASFAAAAVLSAPNAGLKASSWASLGSASSAAGNVAVAVPAYKAAIQDGVIDKSVTKDLSDAIAALGERPATSLTQDYLATQVRAIDETRLYDRGM